MSFSNSHRLSLLTGFYAVSLAFSVLAQVPDVYGQSETDNLLELSLDELMNIQVTSVSKKSEKASQAAAAVFVITREDIKRSGVRSIPEALRMAPGIDVTRIDSNKWAISARGFIGRFANKLLVLFDGRSVYTPFFSGVYWDIQDTLLEDVERIEVIRGSGAAIWGANAVNGVINIITRKASDTQGVYLNAGGGSKERVFGGARYGGKVGEDVYYRVYGKYFERENNDDVNLNPVNDDWRMGRGGFRVDWNATKDDQLGVQGNFYEGKTGGTSIIPNLKTATNRIVNSDTNLAGGNLLMRWNKQIEDNEHLQFQAYYDYTERDSVWIRHEHNILDLDFNHHFLFNEDQEIIWGAGYRFISDDAEGSDALITQRSQLDVHLFSLFIQDEITLVKDRFKVIFGSKFEHNDFSGFEIQPNARFLWTPHQQHTVWGSISRAVRTPARNERWFQVNSAFSPGPKPIQTTIFADIGRHAEELIAYELGYRVKPWSNFSADLALFYNDYDDLRSLQPRDELIDMGNFLRLPVDAVTNMDGESYGVELDLVWQVVDNWRLSGNYSYQKQQFHVLNGSRFSESEEFHTLNHKFSIRSSLDILSNVSWDVWFKLAWTDDRKERAIKEPFAKDINDLLTLDTRLAWRPVKQVELSVVGQNLINNHQLEYFSEFIINRPSQTERSVYGQIEWRF